MCTGTVMLKACRQSSTYMISVLSSHQPQDGGARISPVLRRRNLKLRGEAQLRQAAQGGRGGGQARAPAAGSLVFSLPRPAGPTGTWAAASRPPWHMGCSQQLTNV